MKEIQRRITSLNKIFMKIKFLPAFNGDSILVSYKDSEGKNRNILIDGGTPKTYQRTLKPELENLPRNEYIDLLIVTHIDDDHIGGIKELYQDTTFDRSFIKNVWFNSGNLISDYFKEDRDETREVSIILNDQTNMSVDQGITLEKALIADGQWSQSLIKVSDPILVFGLQITILSPSEKGLKKLNKKWQTEVDTKINMSDEHDDFSTPISELVERKFTQDRAVPNGSSIAILIENTGGKALLLGDAHPSVVIDSLKNLGYSNQNKLKVNIVKVSHHASKGNTKKELLSLIECEKYVISTDGSKHGLPDKEAIARIIVHNPNCKLYFNYDDYSNDLFLTEDFEKFKFEICPLSQMNYTIEL
jgi:beta-lactamase superfamily II metal-dependent hydrolase